jgi:two-component system, OmpR family, phosphate regulon sensor histidine kinase PhoR
LLETRELLKLSQEIASTGSSVWNIDTKIVHFSEAAYRLFGYDPSELTLSHDLAHNLIAAHVHPDDREQVRKSMRYHEQNQDDNYHIFFHIFRKNGEIRYLNVVERRVINDAGGKPRKPLMIFQDVTAQQRYIDALKLDEARLQALRELNNMSGAPAGEISQFTPDKAIELTGSKIGMICIINPEETAAVIFSVSRDMTEGWKMDREHLTFPLSRGILRTEPFWTRKPLIVNNYGHARLGRKGLPAGHGSLKKLLAVPIIDEGRVKLIALVGNKDADYDDSDVRQLTLLMSGVWRAPSRAKAEDELLKAKTRAELYVDLMSHDIMNPNQVSLSFLEFGREQMVEAGMGTGFPDRSNEALKQTSHLIRNVQKIRGAESSAVPLRPIDVNEIIESVIRQNSQHPGRDVKFSYAPAGHRFVLANELLQDVIENIISNAIKHSSGPLYVHISLQGGLSTIVINSRSLSRTTARAFLTESRTRPSNRLYRGESGGKGTGLGLYLVKTLVESYRGESPGGRPRSGRSSQRRTVRPAATGSKRAIGRR